MTPTATKGKGGARPGAGRPKGSMNEETKLRMEALRQWKERAAKNADALFNAQFTLARGVTLLFRIDKDSKGKKLPAVQVTDPEEIKSFLDGEYDNPSDDESYYFITSERPENRAIDSMMDRTFGKAKESIDVTSGGRPLPIMGGISVSSDNGVSEDSGAEEENKDNPGGDEREQDDQHPPVSD